MSYLETINKMNMYDLGHWIYLQSFGYKNPY